MSARKSRKPSVLISRQFTCANAFNNDDDDQTTSTTATSNKNNIFSTKASSKNRRDNESSSDRRNVPRKVIWNGRDATPRPLVGGGRGDIEGEHNCGIDGDHNLLSFEDINNFFESNFDSETNKKEGHDTLLDSKTVLVSWIPTVMEEFCHSCELLDPFYKNV